MLNKAFSIAKTPNNDRYQKGLALLVCKFCGKKSSGRAIKHQDVWWRISRRITQNNYKKISKTKSTLILDNIRNADLADMQLTSNFNKEIRFLLYFVYTFITYTCGILLKDKKIHYNY